MSCYNSLSEMIFLGLEIWDLGIIGLGFMNLGSLRGFWGEQSNMG